MNMHLEEALIVSASKKRDFNITGILFSLIVTGIFIWAAIQWHVLWNGSKQDTTVNTQWCEQRAFLNLQSIVMAQMEYKKNDWDGNGKLDYAKYFVHLWTSVDRGGNPVRIKLIPKKLAFAMDRARVIDGYYFIDLHDRILPRTGELKALDYEREWAVLAVPLTDGRAEKLHFLADTSGTIFAKPARYVPVQYTDDPLSDGWTAVRLIEELRDFQNGQF